MMTIKRAPRLFTALLAAGLLLSLATPGMVQAAVPIQRVPPTADAPLVLPELDLGLFAPGSGWLRSGNSLFLTADNGEHWTAAAVSLPEGHNLADAAFLDPAVGFALSFAIEAETSDLALWKTSDGGLSWAELSPALAGPSSGRLPAPLAEASMQWLDENQGWLLLKQKTSQAFSTGILLRTTDGGQTWMAFDVPAVGKFAFSSAADGYMEDPFTPGSFYHTLDGGATWKADLTAQTPLLLNGFAPEAEALAGLEGEVSAYSSPDGQNAWLVLQQGACDSVSNICAQSQRVQTTQNNGERWEELALPDELTPGSEVAFSRPTPQDSFPDASVPPVYGPYDWVQISQGHAFDACNLPGLQKMQAWAASSPYTSVNLYIGGVSRACPNPLLEAPYLVELFELGWRFIPTWVGPQAPCTNFKNKFSWDPQEAFAQGVTNANQAVDALKALGLTNPDGSGSVVYYDLEHYIAEPACNAAASAFVLGWNDRLEELGVMSGLYHTAKNITFNEYWKLTYAPEVIWAAEWYSTPGFRPDETVWDIIYIRPDLWANHQRVYQYCGSHNETWGGQQINIDSNILDGRVAAPYGSDLVGPVTSATYSGTLGLGDWYKLPVTVTLSAVDAKHSVKHIYYKVDQGDWQLYTAPFQVSGSGLKTVSAVGVDSVNNWGTVASVNFKVDTEPPVNPHVISTGCPALDGAPQGFCNDLLFTWTAAQDAGVGLAEVNPYEVYFGTNANAQSGTRTQHTWYDAPPVPQLTPHYLRVRVLDKHGYWSKWQTIYTLIYDPSFIHQQRLPLIHR